VLAFGVQPFTSRLVGSQPELFRHQWHRLIANASNFLRTDIHPLRVIEDILMFSPSGQEFIYHPPRDTLDKPYRAPIKRHKSKIYRITSKIPNASGYKEYHAATAISLLDFQFLPDERKMETQKPLSLLEFLVKTYTDTGATVLDPTAGSFTTGVACSNSGRNFIGVEKDAQHFQLGVKRLQGLDGCGEDRMAAD
jgi:site-specific DNA-methyltransferase (adenine-specific)